MVDYSKIRGFNYTQSNVWTDTEFWEKYDHDIVDRDMGYAQRLNLNSARIFLTYSSYRKDKTQFLSRVKDFVQTAWAHGISVNPIIYHGFRFHPDDLKGGWRPPATPEDPWPVNRTLRDPSCWHLGEEYFDDLLAAIGNEPGLLFWDISNEPGYTDNFITWYPDEPDYIRTLREPLHNEAAFREAQELTWQCVRHFCRYVKQKDPKHDIGIGNIFIWETEPGGTAELVDVIIFHDYSVTRKRMRDTYDQAIVLGKKYNKPVLNNETCCLCRANPYDAVLELCGEYHIGWYAFELMIGADGWNRVHGMVYPDGTVRDPAIIAALFGFFRNRGESAVRADVDQEGHVEQLAELARRYFVRIRRGFIPPDEKALAEEGLELCEYAANLLEAGELIPMNVPPTATVAALRRKEKPDLDEIGDLLYQWCGILKQACRVL